MTTRQFQLFGLPIAIPSDCIATLYAGRFGRFQIVHCSGAEEHSGALSTTRGYHIVIPLEGALLWQRGAHDPIFADAKTILHIEANDNYKVTHPVGAELSAVFWPSAELVAELTQMRSITLGNDPVVHSCNGEIQLALRQLVRLAPFPESQLAFEETMIDLLGQIFNSISRDRIASFRSRQVVNRAKEYIHANLEQALSLAEIADATGVSPVYLTQLFSQTEGVPLYRYHLDLRLVTSLGRLPQSRNITHLALDLGFSSHAHFSTQFLRHFGLAPSQYRASMEAGWTERQATASQVMSDLADLGMKIIPLIEAKGGRPNAAAA